MTPTVTAALVKKGFTVNIEQGAGIQARFRDEDYTAAGGKISEKEAVFHSGNICMFFSFLLLSRTYSFSS